MVYQKPVSEKIYYGWIVMAACFACAMMVIGGTFYSYQLFVLPVTEEYGISRAAASYAYIAMLISMAAWSPFIGRLLDKFNPRNVIVTGGIAFALAFTLIALSRELSHMLMVIVFLLGLGVASSGGLAANAVTAKWFMKRRGRALGIVSVTSSAGGFIMVPIVSLLINYYGWRLALIITGWGTALLIGLIAMLFIRNRPTAEHLAVTDEFEPSATQNHEIERTWGFREIIATRNFWLLVFGAGLLMASDQAILTSKYPFMVDIGFTPLQATTVISIMTFSAIAGKLLIGYMADYFDIRHLFALVALFHFLLLAVFLIQPNYWSMLIFASIFGAAVGGIYPVWTTLTAAAFGAPSFGAVFGFMAPFMQIMSIVFVRFIGEVHSRTGSYDLAFQFFIFTVILAAGFIYAMRLPGKQEIGIKRDKPATS